MFKALLLGLACFLSIVLASGWTSFDGCQAFQNQVNAGTFFISYKRLGGIDAGWWHAVVNYAQQFNPVSALVMSFVFPGKLVGYPFRSNHGPSWRYLSSLEDSSGFSIFINVTIRGRMAQLELQVQLTSLNVNSRSWFYLSRQKYLTFAFFLHLLWTIPLTLI